MRAGYGRIVNTTSESMLGNTPKATSYAGAKGAIFGFTNALALEGMRHGIRVNAVAPRGTTRAHAPEVMSYVFDQPEAYFRKEFFQQMRPEYVSPAVAYLAHESCVLSGEILVSGAGQVRQLVVSETMGITREAITPEDVAQNVDRICDKADAEIMTIGVPPN